MALVLAGVASPLNLYHHQHQQANLAHLHLLLAGNLQHQWRDHRLPQCPQAPAAVAMKDQQAVAALHQHLELDHRQWVDLVAVLPLLLARRRLPQQPRQRAATTEQSPKEAAADPSCLPKSS